LRRSEILLFAESMLKQAAARVFTPAAFFIDCGVVSIAGPKPVMLNRTGPNRPAATTTACSSV